MHLFRSILVVILSVMLLTSASLGKASSLVVRTQVSVVAEGQVRAPVILKLCKQHYGQGSASCVLDVKALTGDIAGAAYARSGVVPFDAGLPLYRFVPELELPPPRILA